MKKNQKKLFNPRSIAHKTRLWPKLLVVLLVLAASLTWPIKPTLSQSGNAYSNSAMFLGTTSPQIVSGQITAGQTYTINVRLSNNGAGDSPPVAMRAPNPNTTYISNTDISASSPIPISRAYTTCGGTHCWEWVYGSLAAGQSADASFSFRVAANTPIGSNFNFQVYANPASPSSLGNSTPASWLLTVVSSGSSGAQTYLTTSVGDVHAGSTFGDQPCLLNNSTGTITGTVSGNQGSKADAMVSAGGNINEFGSDGAANGTALTLRNTVPYGSYGQICRPDVAKHYLVDDPLTSSPLPNSSYGLSELPNGMYWRGSSLTLTGGTLATGQQTTIIVSGDVYITGNIDYAATYANVDDIPSLGIVASGRILIDPNVSRLYGIFYAGGNNGAGTINTCQSGFGLAPNPQITTAAGKDLCDQPLNVRGALVATNIQFRRTAGDVTAAPAENINYLAQLLLRPPLGLGGVATQLTQ